MKKLTSLVFLEMALFFLLPLSTFGQESAANLDVARQLQELKVKQDSIDRYFELRQEFKQEIAQEASSQVDVIINRWLRTWGVFFSALLFLLGFFGIKEVNKFLLDRIDRKVEQTMLTNYDKITLEQTRFMLVFESEDYVEKKDKKLEVDIAKKMVEKAKKTSDEKLTGKVLDNLITALFNRRDYKNLSLLAFLYEKDMQSPISWANAAIANMDQYELYNAKQYRDFSLKAADCSLHLMPDYGEPYAVKLMILMIDYDRMQNPEEKKKIIQAAKEIIDTVNGGTDTITTYETFNYLKKCGAKTAFNRYYLHIFDILPPEVHLMENRYNEYYARLYPQKEALPVMDEHLDMA